MDDYRDLYRFRILRKMWLTSGERDELKKIKMYKKYGEKDI